MRGRAPSAVSTQDAAHCRMGAGSRAAAGAIGHRDESRCQRFQPPDAGPELLLHRVGLRGHEFERQQRRLVRPPACRERRETRTRQPAFQRRLPPQVGRIFGAIVHGVCFTCSGGKAIGCHDREAMLRVEVRPCLESGAQDLRHFPLGNKDAMNCLPARLGSDTNVLYFVRGMRCVPPSLVTCW